MRPAPEFALPDQNGTEHLLTDYRGKWLVLYFYPKDDTPGCTTEACNFRDAREVIAQLGNAEVVGVSKDSVTSHKQFVDKYHLNFTLLADPEHRVIEAYDSWKSGPLGSGTKRNTFIISPEGMIVKEYVGVDPSTHAAEIINDLKALQGGS